MRIGRFGMNQPVQLPLYSECFQRRTAAYPQSQLVSAGLRVLKSRPPNLGGNSQFLQTLLQVRGNQLQGFLLKAQFLQIVGGHLEKVRVVKTVISKLLWKDFHAADDRCQSVQILVRLEFHVLWQRANLPENMGGNSHTAGAQKRAATAEQPRTFNRIGLKTKSFAKDFVLFAAIAIYDE